MSIKLYFLNELHWWRWLEIELSGYIILIIIYDKVYLCYYYMKNDYLHKDLTAILAYLNIRIIIAWIDGFVWKNPIGLWVDLNFGGSWKNININR